MPDRYGSLDEPLVCIVDDDPHIGEAMQLLLVTAGHRVRVCADARTFLANVSPGQAGCLLLDVRLPGIGGLDLLAELHTYGIGMPTIIVTAYADVAIAVRAMKLGALDLLQKPFPGEDLLVCVRHALGRDRELRAQREHAHALHERLARLSPRELEVLDLVLAGRLNKLIAVELGISESTVEVHRHRVMAKLEVRHLAELVRLYASVRIG